MAVSQGCKSRAEGRLVWIQVFLFRGGYPLSRPTRPTIANDSDERGRPISEQVQAHCPRSSSWPIQSLNTDRGRTPQWIPGQLDGHHAHTQTLLLHGERP